MKDNIFTLVPERFKYDQFWVEIRKRNRWLILLRYGAVIMLASLILGVFFLHIITGKIYIDTLPLWLIASSILVYNLIFHRLWKLYPKIQEKTGFHSLHFSLLQICTDLIALMFFLYFTGGVETPLYVFFVFHVIIGSLFLTGFYIGLIAGITLLITISGAILELKGIIAHHAIQGFLNAPLYNNTSYLIIYFSLFGIAIFLSIYLANSIAKPLYRRERSLTQAYEELENAEKSKSRYVMSVVHDLKTPIAAVMTYINMILEGSLGEVKEEQHRPLERSKLRLTNAITMINDILYISQIKLESGNDNITGVNLDLLFDEIYDETRILMRSKNISYNYICEEKDDVTIQAEPKLLKLAFVNLISNAAKYTENDGKIEVKIHSAKDDVIISVADSGIGIPDSDKEKIFREFYRTALSKQKGIEGTGLGMSIVLQVINKLHGEIKVYSPSYLAMGATKPGTQFIIKLPKVFSVI